MAQADVHHALIFVQALQWQDYADLGWLNAPNLADGDLIFAYDFGPPGNARVIEGLSRSRRVLLRSHAAVSVGGRATEISESNPVGEPTCSPVSRVDTRIDPYARICLIHRAISFMPCAETLCPTRCS